VSNDNRIVKKIKEELARREASNGAARNTLDLQNHDDPWTLNPLNLATLRLDERNANSLRLHLSTKWETFNVGRDIYLNEKMINAFSHDLHIIPNGQPVVFPSAGEDGIIRSQFDEVVAESCSELLERGITPRSMKPRVGVGKQTIVVSRRVALPPGHTMACVGRWLFFFSRHGLRVCEEIVGDYRFEMVEAEARGRPIAERRALCVHYWGRFALSALDLLLSGTIGKLFKVLKGG
jgi:hypothetical protein